MMKKIILGILLCTLIFSCCTDIIAYNDGVTVDEYKMRSERLMNAMDDVGVFHAEDAVELWVKGLEDRSAAIQYSVLSKELKARYAKDLEITVIA